MCIDDAEWAARRWRSREGLSSAGRLCLALGHRLDAVVWTAARSWGSDERVRRFAEFLCRIGVGAVWKDPAVTGPRQSAENLARTWSSLEQLCSSLTEEEWKRPTALPRWTVQDNVSHIVDFELRALGDPAPDHAPADLTHARNDLARANEIGVDYRRSWPGSRVLAEFRQVTRRRLAQLRSLDDEDFDRPVETPTGPGTLAELMRMRVMDCWTHEQDIRRALRLPGHLEGPVVTEALGYLTRFLPYVVGKRAGASDGTTVVVEIEGVDPLGIEVVGRRAHRATPPPAPDVRVRMDVPTYLALATGRSTRYETVEIMGDLDLGRRILEGMNVMV